MDPVKTAKMTTATSDIVHHNTYTSIIPEELGEPVKQYLMTIFLQTTKNR